MRLLVFYNNDWCVLTPGTDWGDGFTFYGVFFHEIIPDAEKVFGVKID
jgi:hypothetical protein